MLFRSVCIDSNDMYMDVVNASIEQLFQCLNEYEKFKRRIELREPPMPYFRDKVNGEDVEVLRNALVKYDKVLEEEYGFWQSVLRSFLSEY